MAESCESSPSPRIQDTQDKHSQMNHSASSPSKAPSSTNNQTAAAAATSAHHYLPHSTTNIMIRLSPGSTTRREEFQDSMRFPKPTVTQKLFELLMYVVKKESMIENKRCKLARMDRFEPRQAFQRIARDMHRMEAPDIFNYIGRFEEHETHTIDACHLTVKYWNQSVKAIGLKLQQIEEGSLTLIDFSQLVLPNDNTVLRATASQRVTGPPENMVRSVESQLAHFLKLEVDFQETFERMKIELENLKGYSIKKLFRKIDQMNRGFIDVTSLREFMVMCDPLLQEKKKMGFKRGLTGLMRRLATNTDGKITFSEFATLLKPVDLRPYLKRIRKFTKEEKKQVEMCKIAKFKKQCTETRNGLRKPLTAFLGSKVMLDRDPERHVGLMPAKYGISNKSKLLSEVSPSRQSVIELEASQLRQPKSMFQSTGHHSSLRLLRKKSTERPQTEQKAMHETLGGGGIADFYERKVTSHEVYEGIKANQRAREDSLRYQEDLAREKEQAKRQLKKRPKSSNAASGGVSGQRRSQQKGMAKNSGIMTNLVAGSSQRQQSAMSNRINVRRTAAAATQSNSILKNFELQNRQSTAAHCKTEATAIKSGKKQKQPSVLSTSAVDKEHASNRKTGTKFDLIKAVQSIQDSNKIGSDVHYDSLLQQRKSGKVVVRRHDEDYDSPFDDEGEYMDNVSISNFSKRYMSDYDSVQQKQVELEANVDYLHELTQKAFLQATGTGDHLEYEPLIAQKSGSLPTRLLKQAMSRKIVPSEQEKRGILDESRVKTEQRRIDQQAQLHGGVAHELTCTPLSH